MAISKLHQLKNKQKIEEKSECILHIEINKKVPYKTIRKIDIKNVTRFFLS